MYALGANFNRKENGLMEEEKVENETVSIKVGFNGYEFILDGYEMSFSIQRKNFGEDHKTIYTLPWIKGKNGVIDITAICECYEKIKSENPESDIRVLFKGFHPELPAFDPALLSHPMPEIFCSTLSNRNNSSILFKRPKKDEDGQVNQERQEENG